MRFLNLIIILLAMSVTVSGCLFESDAIVGTYTTKIGNPNAGGTLAVFNSSGTFFLGSPPYQGKVNGTWKRLNDAEVQLTYNNGKKETIVYGSKKGVFQAQEIVIQGARLVRMAQK